MNEMEYRDYQPIFCQCSNLLDMKEIIKKIEKNKMLLKIDSCLYDKEALLQALYKYTDKCYLNIELVDNYFEIYFESKNDSENLEKIALNFGNEIIDQQIRIRTG